MFQRNLHNRQASACVDSVQCSLHFPMAVHSVYGSNSQVVECMFPADSVVCVFPIGSVQHICSAWAVNSVRVPYNKHVV